jgi:hypothetical protein
MAHRNLFVIAGVFPVVYLAYSAMDALSFNYPKSTLGLVIAVGGYFILVRFIASFR